MAYKIKASAEFSAAHNLRGYRGKCETLHGHNWKVEVKLAKDTLDKEGMVTDFTLVKHKLSEVLNKLDHKYLNEIPYFKKINPTSENIAKYIYDQLKKSLPCLYAVTVWESENSRATFSATPKDT
jgi:6-pyruvoyltetrahydropterin/6-carboxytetrahydropterin synthase